MQMGSKRITHSRDYVGGIVRIILVVLSVCSWHHFKMKTGILSIDMLSCEGCSPFVSFFFRYECGSRPHQWYVKKIRTIITPKNSIRRAPVGTLADSRFSHRANERSHHRSRQCNRGLQQRHSVAGRFREHLSQPARACMQSIADEVKSIVELFRCLMDNQQLRSILLKLQDRLSDNDRQRLHFILGNDIPRRIRDNLTHNGTLNLLDCLIDQDKINERDFTFLINAFKEIQCVEAVKILAGIQHDEQALSDVLLMLKFHSRVEFKRLTALNDKTSLGDEITQDQDDCRDVTHACKSLTPILPSLVSCRCTVIPKVTNYGNFNNIINTNSTNINPVTITMENQTMRQSSTSDDRFVKLSLRTSVYVCAGMLFFVVVVGLLLTMLLVQNNQRNGLDGVQKHGTFFEEQTPTNSKTGLFNQILAERDAYIRQLEDQLTLQQIEKGE